MMDRTDAGEREWYEHLMEQYGAAQSLIMIGADRFFARLRIFFSNVVYRTVWLFLLGILVLAAVMTYRATDQSFEQSFLVEVTSGIATFLLAPVVLSIDKRHRRAVYASIVVGSILSGLGSFLTDGLIQSFLLEASVSLLLLLALDIAFNAMEAKAMELVRYAKQKSDDLEARIDEAERTLAPRHVALGGGTVDETIAFDNVKRFDEILKTLSSDAHCDDKDLIYIIGYVNDLKRDNPDEYSRIRAWLK